MPTTKDDLARRSAMNKVWADATLGFMGRTPDYLNVNVMAAGMAADYFSQCDPRFGRNALAYFEHVREHDLALTHALTNPQVDRSKSASELDRPVHRPRASSARPPTGSSSAARGCWPRCRSPTRS